MGDRCFSRREARQPKRRLRPEVVVALLGGAFVTFIAGVALAIGSSGPIAKSDTALAAEPVRLPASRPRVVVAAQRIEKGMRLEPFHLVAREAPEGVNPEGVIFVEAVNRVVGHYAKEPINPGVPLAADQFTEEPPNSPIEVPPGFRAVTVQLNRREAGNGFFSPGDRVDILYTKRSSGQPVTKRVLESIQILAINDKARQGDSSHQEVGDTPVFALLLATERDALKIELMRSEGEISFALVSRHDPILERRAEKIAVTLDDLDDLDDAARRKRRCKNSASAQGENGGAPQQYCLGSEGWDRISPTPSNL